MPDALSQEVSATLLAGVPHQAPRLTGLRAGMVVFSAYPADPRPRRAVEALLQEGMDLDLICQGDRSHSRQESGGRLTVMHIPIRNARGGVLAYAYQYVAFTTISAAIFAWRSLRGRYDLIYVHNMPDVLVLAALVPKLLGAKVILDQHDPMPELLMTIFGKTERSLGVRVLKLLEKCSVAFADRVITVNAACKRIFSSRSCSADKISVVMNCPDEAHFPHCAPDSYPLHPPGAPFVMMYHGSMVERNGLDLAVQAMAQLVKTVPNVELRAYGHRTSYLDQVLERVTRMGLEKHFRYLGPRQLEQLAEEIGWCDIGVIPNHRNIFTALNTPTRIFEYLALGKPVIAPNTPGIRDYFDEHSLIYFESGNAGDLADAMKQAAMYPAVTREVAQRGQQVYLRHTWKREREALLTVVADAVRANLTLEMSL